MLTNFKFHTKMIDNVRATVYQKAIPLDSKSRGTKVAYRAKTHIFAPERYTAGI